jgi:hypothetical protein
MPGILATDCTFLKIKDFTHDVDYPESLGRISDTRGKILVEILLESPI